MGPELGILLLRLALLGCLYLFLGAVVLVVARDLGRGGRAPEPPSRQGKGRLLVIGDEAGLAAREFALLGVTILGRDPACTIQVPDTFASARHAQLTWQGGRWWLEDLGSTNGTQLNDRDVVKRTPVRFNDTIQIGRVRFKLSPE